MGGLFVTGTDTEIGKTFVSTGIVSTLVTEGFKVAGMKPIGTGGTRDPKQKEILNEDAGLLMSAANLPLSRGDLNLYSYLPPTSPHIAASEADELIDLNKICQAYRKIDHLCDYVIVEGVGGWMVPLNETDNVENLAIELGLPILLVVGVKLGCINHALLTRDALVRSGVTVAGWVANMLEPDLYAKEKVVRTIEETIEFPYWGEIPFYSQDKNPTLPPMVTSNLMRYLSSRTKT